MEKIELVRARENLDIRGFSTVEVTAMRRLRRWRRVTRWIALLGTIAGGVEFVSPSTA